jgi:SAM-dependent methyltransferase
MIAQCHSFGLDVTESDAIDFLKKHEPDTFSVITGFHFVEHLPLKNLIELFDESRRVLRPGGMVIFETPNPENLIVGAFTFYLDPSHGRPIVPDSLEFIARERGFIETFILRLHKFSDFHDIKETEDEFKKRWFYSETDYAILCYKAL